VLRLAGELDLATVPVFEEAREALHGAYSAIVLDLSALEFIDSSGLRAVIAAQQLTEGAGARFEIVPGPPAVQRVFEVTGLDRQLSFRSR